MAALEDNICSSEEALARNETIVGLDIAFHTVISQAPDNRSHAAGPRADELAVLSVSGSAAAKASARRTASVGRSCHDAAKAGEWTNKHIVDFKRGFMVVKPDMERPVEQLSLAHDRRLKSNEAGVEWQ
ncbi:MAG: hypothetical protein ABSC37_21625 [Xanthobacteraceae bacterium]|jgi:hypothetical protein